MNRKLQHNLEQYAKKTRGHRLWQGFVRVVAGAVVFCTTYALILPAITMEQQAFCGLEEHVHGDECYIQISNPVETTSVVETTGHVHTDTCLDESGAEICGFHVHNDSCYTPERGELICQQAEQDGHVHTELCYAEEPVMTCQTAETDGHTHGDTCYTSQQVLSCQLGEAEAHTHGEGCFDAEGNLICQIAETDGHTHGDTCYTPQQVLSCQLDEAEPHTHGGDCWEYPLICGQTAAESHTHNDDCYQWNSTLTCDLPLAPAEVVQPQPELTCQDSSHVHTERCYGTWELCCDKEEHTHSLACFSNPDADVETREVWERTLAGVELTGMWSEDVLAIAKSQLGYQESTRNYAVWEDGTTHGYTRYGQWYGSPYGDWCAMFASFCISYAGVDENAMPRNWGCRTWIADLSQSGVDLYRPAADYTPKPGDLIFFDWEDADGSSDGLSDHVGIVAELIPATEEQPAKIKTIEGNSSNQVKYNTYEQADTQILGYGVIPENPAYGKPEETEFPVETGTAGNTYTYSDDMLYVEVRLPADSTVPADAVLVVTPIGEEDADYGTYLAQTENAVEGLVSGIALYDISFYTPEGEYIPVSDTAQVTMGFTQSPVDGEGEIRVLHFAQENTLPQVIDQVTIGEQELEMHVGNMPQDTPAPMALDLPGEPTQEDPTEETEPVPETITEVRTVVQFQADGFSTFAVVQVEKGYVTTILDNVDMGNLNGRVFAISTRNKLTYDKKAAHRGLTRVATGDNHLVSLEVTRGENNTITVGKSMLWQFEAVNGQTNTYYVRPYNPETDTAEGYLKLYDGDQEYLSVEATQETASTVQLQNDQYGNPSFKRPDGRYLAYSAENNYFTSFNTPTENRGNLILSEYLTAQQDTPVINLSGQYIIWATNGGDSAVTSETTDFDDNGSDRLGLKTIARNENLKLENGIVTVPEGAQVASWTFTQTETLGEYHIQLVDGQYLHLDASGVTLKDDPQAIEVVEGTNTGGIANVVCLRVHDGGTTQYLNLCQNDNTKGVTSYANQNTSTGDNGNHFVLARREQFTAEVISRAELWSAGRWTGNKLIFFVRQTDVYGTTRYYAMNVDGSATEVFLEPGQTLKDGATIYADVATRDKFLWNANGSPTGNGTWNAGNNVNGAIDLWARNTSTGTELVLSPNGDGGWGKVNAADPYYVHPGGGASITSHVESATNWGWYILDNGNHEDRTGSPLRGQHNAAFHRIANGSPTDINPDIASTIVSDMAYTHQSWNSGYIEYENGQFVSKHSPSDNFNTQANVPATDSTAFYVAVLNIPEEEIVETESHDNVVAKVLTRHELQDAAKMDEAKLIFFTQQGDKYYALDYQGNAVELTAVDDKLEAGMRFLLTGTEGYNSNRILWDGTGTAMDANAENISGLGGYVDLWLGSVAASGQRYLSASPESICSQSPNREANHAPGFYGLDDGLKNLLVTGNGADGDYVIRYEDGKYTVVPRQGDQTGEPFTFYAALVTDNTTTQTVIPGVKENVRMRLFNYGSAIDYYGQSYNGTTYNDGQTVDGNYDKDNLIYRFFHRPVFKGQAIDGTNEKTDEYAKADAFEGKKRNYSANLGADGAPHISLANTTATAMTYPGEFSLGYLFGANDFVRSTKDLTLHQTGGGDWQVIPGGNNTQVNANGTTAPAGGYDPIQNPNYAVQSFNITNNGEGTGLFRFDRDTGNYYYDSAVNAAWYNPDTQKMQLYNYAIIPSGSMACIGGNFLPFNLGHEDGRLVTTNSSWQGVHKYPINSRTYQLNGIHHDTDPVIGRSDMSDMWFGMTLEIDFTMTDDGTLIPIDPDGKPVGTEKKDMVFDFTGDDDVLVYVDDVLCLDIGGIHGAESGDINFATGIITHKGEEQSTLSKRYAAADKDNLIGDNGLLKPWTKHTLKFFYMERGGNISNCRIAYNLADIPVGGMSVTKEVTGVEDSQEYYGEYQFQLILNELGATTADELYYTVRNQNGQIVTGKEKITFTEQQLKNNDVVFTLQANQVAEFFGFPAGTKLQVQEIGRISGQEIAQVKMNGVLQESSANWISREIHIEDKNMQDCRVVCTNELKPVTVNITKVLEMLGGAAYTGQVKDFKLKYTITKPDGSKDGPTEITVQSGKTHEITEVPFGSWLEIEEVTMDGYKVKWDYKVKKAEPAGIIGQGSGLSDEEFKKLGAIHLLGDTEITCRNQMTYVTVKKTVEGGATTDKFTFLYTVSYNGAETATGKFQLGHDETARIPNLLFGSQVTVTEETGEGEFLTSYVIYPTANGPGETDSKRDGKKATVENLQDPMTIHFTNRPMYILPETGGRGTSLYTMGGLLLMAAAILLYYQIRRRKGDHASP